MEEYIVFWILCFFAVISIFLYILFLREDLKSEKQFNEEKRERINEIRKMCLALYCKVCNISLMDFERKYRRDYYALEAEEILSYIGEKINELNAKNDNKFQNLKNEYEQTIAEIKTERCTDKLYRLAEKISEKELENFDKLAVVLECQKHPAIEAAKKTREAKKIAKEFEKKYKLMKYEYDILFALFPELENYLDYYDENSDNESIDEYKESFDYVKNWVSKEEYMRLSENERNQLALDKYVEKRKKSKWQVGRDYEMFIGYEFENKGYDVDYTGIKNGLEDKGRDLIAKKEDEILIIQCKNWSRNKTIREKHICQLFGTAVKYGLDNNVKVTPLFVTTTSLSDDALDFAGFLGVRVLANYDIKDFPRIKCNINHGEKIYHLPFDQQYDRTQIKNKGEFYAWTVQEAVDKGFKRAKKYFLEKD